MYGSDFGYFSYWWVIPIVMMVLCFLMMRGRRCSMMCGFGSRGKDGQQTEASNSATDILDKRYASGEINRDEYEEMKKTLTESTGRIDD